jgi:hypothetical protein
MTTFRNGLANKLINILLIVRNKHLNSNREDVNTKETHDLHRFG